MKLVTASDIKALRPCWQPAQIDTTISKGKTPQQIARAVSVSVSDRRWVLTKLAARTKEGRKALALWAAGCAQDARDMVTDEDTRDACDVCVAVAVAFVAGCATQQECNAAAASASAAIASEASYASAAYAAYNAANAAASAYNSAYNSAAAYYASAASAIAFPKNEKKHMLQLAEVVAANM